MNNIPKTHFFTQEDLPLFEINQIFSACSVWLEQGMDKLEATTDLVVRDMPKNRNFLVFTGLEEVVEGIKKWGYTNEEAEYLLKRQVITTNFADYLKKYKFSGSVHAMPEGSIFFPGEPVVRVTGPIIDCNLISLFLINAVASNTIFSSKVIRAVLAASPKLLISGGMRAHSFESAMKYTRVCTIVGALGEFTSSCLRKYKHPLIPSPLTQVYHAAIKSFPSEFEAMEAFAKLFPGTLNVMVDTYDFKKGVENAIKIAKKYRENGKPGIRGITIDSGDLCALAKYTRKELDAAGLKDVRITIASNLDEYKILKLQKKKTPTDSYMAVTDLVTVADDPKLEVVYKLAELRANNKTTYCAKFSPGKESYPGRKQVFRQYNNSGKMTKDIIGLNSEKLGKPLLVPYLKKGILIQKLPSLNKIREHLFEQLDTLPSKYKAIDKQYAYPVQVSKKISDILVKLKEDL